MVSIEDAALADGAEGNGLGEFVTFGEEVSIVMSLVTGGAKVDAEVFVRGRCFVDWNFDLRMVGCFAVGVSDREWECVCWSYVVLAMTMVGPSNDVDGTFVYF